jgi:hypothetical protein
MRAQLCLVIIAVWTIPACGRDGSLHRSRTGAGGAGGQAPGAGGSSARDAATGRGVATGSDGATRRTTGLGHCDLFASALNNIDGCSTGRADPHCIGDRDYWDCVVAPCGPSFAHCYSVTEDRGPRCRYDFWGSCADVARCLLSCDCSSNAWRCEADCVAKHVLGNVESLACAVENDSCVPRTHCEAPGNCTELIPPDAAVTDAPVEVTDAPAISEAGGERPNVVDGGGCTWPESYTPTKDGSAVGCLAHPIPGPVDADQMTCSSAVFALGCVGEWPYTDGGRPVHPTVPTPDPSLGCRILPIPTPIDASFYCCPCGS